MNSCIKNIVHACALQLVLATAALPFLLWWRIPFPLLSIAGNLIHPLVLTTFLCLASLLFFTTVLGIPDSLLIKGLSALTYYWNTLFNMKIPSGWLALHWWHIIPALGIATIALCVILLPELITHRKSISFAAFSISCITLCWQLPAQERGITFLRKGEHCLVCVPHPGSVELIDFGYIGRARNKEALMTYDVLPHLLFTYGTSAYNLEQATPA